MRLFIVGLLAFGLMGNVFGANDCYAYTACGGYKNKTLQKFNIPSKGKIKKGKVYKLPCTPPKGATHASIKNYRKHEDCKDIVVRSNGKSKKGFKKEITIKGCGKRVHEENYEVYYYKKSGRKWISLGSAPETNNLGQHGACGKKKGVSGSGCGTGG